jgi:hypothetical protein
VERIHSFTSSCELDHEPLGSTNLLGLILMAEFHGASQSVSLEVNSRAVSPHSLAHKGIGSQISSAVDANTVSL